MPRPPNARVGDSLRVAPLGFPVFFDRRRRSRVITGDIWAYLRHISREKLRQRSYAKAISYIDQAYDFYSAASNPRQASRPLLYYYAFLNLGKLLLLHQGLQLPNKLKHGIADPRANTQNSLKFRTQRVTIEGVAADHSLLFPELVRVLQSPAQVRTTGDFKVFALLSQIPAIHRTFTMDSNEESDFCPIKQIEVLSGESEIWARIAVKANDKDVQGVIKSLQGSQRFRAIMKRVSVPDSTDDTIYFETNTIAYVKSQLDQKIDELAKRIREIGIWTLLSPTGYMYYFKAYNRQQWLPQFCSAYAVMFYLGSITRYKPYDYQSIVSEHAWLINDFLRTQPAQMLYLLASYLAGTEVVSPQAISILAPSIL